MPRQRHDWTDAAVRQMFLDATGWDNYVGPNIQLSKPGLPDNFQSWTLADRHAYQWLLDKSGNPKRIARAFGLTQLPGPVDGMRRAAKECAGIIAEVFPKLQGIVKRYEATIRSRWVKRGEAERAKILNKAWPRLFKDRRPDLRWLQSHKINLSQLDAGLTERQAIWRAFEAPHMTVDALVRGNAMLRLLNSRARHEPALFAHLDLEGIEVGRRAGGVPVDFAACRIDLHLPVSSGRYGALKKDFVRADLEAICSHRGWALNDGLHVLRFQFCILDLLESFCRTILHDKELDDDTIPVEPEPTPLSVHVDETVWALQRPFRVPRTLVNLDSMVRQAKTALDEAREHVWLLRDDPAHFETTVRDHMDHAYVYIKDSEGQFEAIAANMKQNPEPHVSASAKEMIEEDFTAVLHWEAIISLLEEAAEHRERFVQSGAMFEEDSPEYLNALLRLRVALDDYALMNAAETLFRNLTTSPSLRHCFERRGPELNVVAAKEKGECGRLADDPLFWLIFQGFAQVAGSDETTVAAIPMDDLLVEVHRLVEEKAKEFRRLLSPFTLKAIADAGFLADLRCQLTSLHPRIFSPFRGLGFEKTVCDEKTSEETKQWLLQNTKYEMVLELKVLLDSDTFPSLGKLADPEKNRFRHPIHLKRTLESTRVLQKAENNLDEFWKTVDAAINADKQHDKLLAHIKSWQGSSEYTRTPDWAPPSPPTSRLPRPVVLPRIANQLANLNLNGQQGNGQVRPQARTAVLQQANSRKEKPKTRGVVDPARAEQAAANRRQQPAAQPAAQPPAAPPPPPPQVLFQLSARSMRVIRMLFHHPGDHNQSGDVDWKDFLHAMAEMGFSAAKLYGSVWNLAPTGDKLASRPGARDIRIHEPHPVAKLRFYQARRFGARVREVFGVDAGCFEER